VSVVAFEISDGIANFTVLVCLLVLLRSSIKPFSDEAGGDGGKASDIDDNSVTSVLIIIIIHIIRRRRST
jgi:hypothetical protein